MITGDVIIRGSHASFLIIKNSCFHKLICPYVRPSGLRLNDDTKKAASAPKILNEKQVVYFDNFCSY